MYIYIYTYIIIFSNKRRRGLRQHHRGKRLGVARHGLIMTIVTITSSSSSSSSSSSTTTTTATTTTTTTTNNAYNTITNM